MSTVLQLMTAEEFLALPTDDGIDRELIRGQLRERPMTYRNRWHGRVEARTAALLIIWLDNNPPAKGVVYSGEIGTILRHDPDTIVGIDVALFPPAVVERQTEVTTLIDGIPLLAVEILSPSDRNDEVREKVQDYLAAGVRLVWVIDPYFQTVQVHRPDAKPESFNTDQVLTGGPDLPGLQIPVARLFE